MIDWPGSIDETSTSIEASASAEASGFIWSMKGQSVAAAPTAAKAPVAISRKSRRVTPSPDLMRVDMLGAGRGSDGMGRVSQVLPLALERRSVQFVAGHREQQTRADGPPRTTADAAARLLSSSCWSVQPGGPRHGNLSQACNTPVGAGPSCGYRKITWLRPAHVGGSRAQDAGPVFSTNVWKIEPRNDVAADEGGRCSRLRRAGRMSQQAIDILNRWMAEAVRPVPAEQMDKEAARLATEFAAYAEDAGLSIEELELDVGEDHRELHEGCPVGRG